MISRRIQPPDGIIDRMTYKDQRTIMPAPYRTEGININEKTRDILETADILIFHNILKVIKIESVIQGVEIDKA